MSSGNSDAFFGVNGLTWCVDYSAILIWSNCAPWSSGRAQLLTKRVIQSFSRWCEQDDFWGEVMTTLKIVLNGMAALFGLVAAVLWWQSTRVKVPPQPDNPHGFAEAQIISDGADFIASAREQTYWNRWAATAAAIAALSQAVAVMLSN
jgi:hypothetical protein